MTGKERIDYPLGLGSSLAEFGSLMGKFQPVLKCNSTIAWFLWNCITKFSTQDPGHLVICSFVFPLICLIIPWHSWQIPMIFQTAHLENFLDAIALCVLKAQQDSSAAIQLLFLLKMTKRRGNGGLPSFGALDYWRLRCDGLEVTLSSSLVSRRWSQVIANANMCLSSGIDFLPCPVSTVWELWKSPFGSARKEEGEEGLPSTCAIINAKQGLEVQWGEQTRLETPSGDWWDWTSMQTCDDQHPDTDVSLSCLWLVSQ